MSLTITELRGGAGRQFLGTQKRIPVTVLFDNSYAANGESVRVTDAPFSASETILGFVPWGGIAGCGYHVDYDYTNEKIRMLRALAGEKIPYSPAAGDLKGSTNLAGTEGNADQNATAVNGALLLAGTSFTVLAGTMTPTTQPDVPRNIVIQVQNGTGGSLDLFQGTTTFTITGTDADGAAQTETVALTSTVGNKGVAASKFRFVQGSKAFRTVTSVTYDNAPAGSLLGSLGVGSRIGLPAALETATHTDVLSLTINAARTATSATVANAGGVDTTNNTVNAGTLANGDDVGIVFKAAAQQVATGTDLSALTIRGEFIVL